MKLAVCLLAAVGLTLATKIPSESWEREHYPEFELKETVFRPNKEYRFVYNGQVCMGYPGSSRQHSATRIQSVVSLVFKSRSEVVMKLLQCRLGNLNRRLSNPQALIPFMAFQEVPVEQEFLEKLREPVKFSYSKGMINDIVFDESDAPWSANIKRGILNMLQVNLHRHNPTNLGEELRLTNQIPESVNPKQDFFSVMEETLEGQCETHYTLTSQPSPIYSSGPVLNVTKSINFEHCRKRPEIRYNFRFQENCPSCNPDFEQSEKIVKSSSVFRYNISGTPEEFAIESAIVESQYMITPFKKNPAMIYVNQTLVLMNSGEIRTQVSGPKNPRPSDSQMVYTLDWDIRREKLHMEGASQVPNHPFKSIPNKLRMCENVLRKLVQEMTPSITQDAPEEYLRLVKVLRTLEPSELERVHQTFMKGTPEQFTPEQITKIRSLLPNALADACTKDTVSHLVSKITKREISPVPAAFSIKGLVHCRTVGKPMIEELETLLSSPVCERHWFLKQAVSLTMGSLMNALCAPNEDKLAMEFKHQPEHFCPRQLKTEFVEKLIQKFKTEPTYYEKVLILKTLSNAGLPESIVPLEKIIKEIGYEKLPPTLKTEAIMALRQVLKPMPQTVRKVLMPIFMNARLPTEMRIAAVYQILETQPSRPILDQISNQLFRERRIQVASFVYSYMTSLANATSHPCLKKFARDLQLSLRHGRRISKAFYPGYSKYIYGSFFNRKYGYGLEVALASVMSPYSMIPRHLSVSTHETIMGSWTKYLMTFGVTTKQLERHIYEYLDKWTESSYDEFLVRQPRSTQTVSPINELKRLFKSFSLKNRELPLPENAQGYFYMKWMDQESTFLPFSPETIKEYFSNMWSSGTWSLEKINSWLESGKHLHISSGAILSETVYKIPTTLGLPLKASIASPRVIKLNGQIKGQISPERAIFECNECNPSYAASMVAKISCWTPMVMSGLKVVASGKIHLPMDTKVEFSRPSSKEVEMKWIWSPPKSQVQWFHLESRPVTFISLLPVHLQSFLYPQEKTVHGEEYTRVYNIEKDFPIVKPWEKYVENFLGIPMRVSGQWHHVPEAHLTGTPVCPLSGPNKLSIVTQPNPETPKEIIFKSLVKISQPSRNIKTSFNDVSGEKFSFQDDESWTASMKTELKTKGSPKDCSCELETKLRCSPEARLCKLSTEFQRSRIPDYDSSPFKVCMEGELLYPETPYSLQQISGKQVVSQLKTTWGRQCQPSNFINIKVQAEQTPEHVSYLERSHPEYSLYQSQRCQRNPEQCSPVQTYETVLKASNLLKYKLKAEWENVSPIVKNFTNKIYRALKFYYYWNTEVNQINVNNPEKELEVVLKIDPKHRRLINVTVETPKERVKFMDIPVPMPIRPLNIRRKFSPWRLSEIFQETINGGSGVCRVSPRRIQTFDGVEYHVPLSTCWSLLAKDCMSMETPRFAVLMKKISTESHQKKVKIVTRSQIVEISPESESFESLKVKVNGRQITPSETPEEITHQGQVVVRIEKEGSYVKVSLPKTAVRVYFDGYACNIKLPPWMQNRQCGLCGHYNEEPSDEWMKNDNQLTHDVREFYKTYTMNEEGCQYPSSLEEICPSPECRYVSPFQPRTNSHEFSWESSSEQKSSEESFERELTPQEPEPQTKVIEQGSKVCFSKTPVPTCPHHTYPGSYKQKTEKIVFCCLPRDDIQATILLRKVLRERQIPQELSQLPSSFTETYPIPSTCKYL